MPILKSKNNNIEGFCLTGSSEPISNQFLPTFMCSHGAAMFQFLVPSLGRTFDSKSYVRCPFSYYSYGVSCSSIYFNIHILYILYN